MTEWAGKAVEASILLRRLPHSQYKRAENLLAPVALQKEKDPFFLTPMYQLSACRVPSSSSIYSLPVRPFVCWSCSMRNQLQPFQCLRSLLRGLALLAFL